MTSFRILLVLAASLALALIGCQLTGEAPAPSPTGQAQTPTAPPPAATPVPTVAPRETDFEVNVSQASMQLPDSIIFHLQGRGERPIEMVDLEFGSEVAFSCASSEYHSARIKVGGERDVSLTKEWDMRRTGSIPPGATVWWRWRVVDDLGQEFLSPRQEVIYNDERYDWRTHTSGNITFYWYGGGGGFGRRLADSVRDGLANLRLGGDLTAPVKAFVYESADDLLGAVLFSQAWTGGLAFTSHNILLITVDPLEYETYISGLIHELAHLLINELTFNCFGDLPTWLEEGLATYAEGDLTEYQRTALEAAIANDELISLRSLNSSFPADHSGAHLSYSQSWSLVDYLITEHGWTRMRRLLSAFAEGETYEQAIEKVYGMDLDRLQTAWLHSLGLN